MFDTAVKDVEANFSPWYDEITIYDLEAEQCIPILIFTATP